MGAQESRLVQWEETQQSPHQKLPCPLRAQHHPCEAPINRRHPSTMRHQSSQQEHNLGGVVPENSADLNLLQKRLHCCKQ